MNLLAIDTSTDLATVALSVQGHIQCAQQAHVRQHAQFLLPMIQGLLASAESKLSQLDGIVFGRGPGSFTGLRIACSVAQALAYAHDLPLFAVSTLTAIAYSTYQKETALPAATHVLAMIDARMHQVYWECFTSELLNLDGKVTDAKEITLPMGPTIIAGVGFEAYTVQLPQIIQANILKQITIFPQAEAMIHLVHCGKIQAVNAADAMPVYVRNHVAQGDTRG
jgi:tRNA threonylcarbamoyladenosine biosynthesis protein TsaB